MRLATAVDAFVLAAAAIGGTASATQQPDIMSRAINTPGITYSFYGTGYTARVVKDAGVVGGQAYRVTVAQPAPHPYDIDATAAIARPIRRGDTLVVAVWMRAPKAGEGATLRMPFVGIIGPAPGYPQVVAGEAQATPTWTLHTVRGTAEDYQPGQASVTLHLGAQKGVIDLGPVFVLDLGQGAR